MASDAEDRVKDWWESFLRGAEAGVREAALDIIETSKPIISDEAIDRSTLLNSTESPDAVLRISRFHYHAKWSAEHASFVNYGTGPGHYPDPRGQYIPPFEAILAWVKRNARLFSSVSIESGFEGVDDVLGPTVVDVDGGAVIKPRTKQGTRKLPDAAARKLARAIQMKIFKMGTEPVLFAERSRDIVMPRFNRILEENIERELAAWERRGRAGGEA